MTSLNVMYGSNVNGPRFILSRIALAQSSGKGSVVTIGSTSRQRCATVRTTGRTPQQGKHASSFCRALGSTILVQGLGTDIQSELVGTQRQVHLRRLSVSVHSDTGDALLQLTRNRNGL